ncbi:MAG TPA: hypothetical protein VFE47_05545 [Tepidisphaeraceae bacterium]|jgi:hypothetical protein|nr:hypothetical protein [Tepidisphaeraceae bacterium]
MSAIVSATILTLLRSRRFRVAFLAFQFLWLNIVVPGHRRGIVSLPGSECCECQTGAPAPAHDRCAKCPKVPDRTPTDPARHCAICFFSARLSPAVAVDLSHPKLELFGAVEDPPAVISHSSPFSPTCQERAPPAVVA